MTASGLTSTVMVCSTLCCLRLLHKRKRAGDILQRLPLRLDRKEPGDDTCPCHERGTNQVALEDIQRLARLDERAKQHWGHRCGSCTNGVEQSNRQGTDLQREHLAHRQVSRACASGGEEEDDRPADS